MLSHDDQEKGICIKTSSNKVTVQGVLQTFSRYLSYYRRFYYYYGYYYYKKNQLETFVAIPVIDLCSSEYEYYAMSVNSTSSYYNSLVLVIGTEDNTMMKLKVSQSVTISVGNVTTNLIPGKEYSFMIDRVQTVYIESPGDLTGSKIVTD